MNRENLDLFIAQFSNCNVTSKKRKSKTKRDFFITYQSHFSVEINAHSLTCLAVLFSEGQVPPEALNIWLQNSQTCEKLSRTIAHHLGQSWAREIDENINQDSDVESDNETDNNMANDLASNSDSEEDLEFDDGFDSISNVTTSANRGVRLVDNVKEKFSQTYFRVTIKKQNKFLHKQTACWFLEKDKSSLPADRLSRVQEQ
ncbi:unnamed protein product [Rotaria magnacalcarata]|uniref:Uncharacterized protein n=3 Tax=Rotaria magnacalcarata TaxID=392030 RepID=A0A8S3F3J8_9BILA|nr:unnamed protein product [Rotaria magnacalcarata]